MKTPNQIGTYAAVTFHTDTNKAIHNYIRAAKLPNAVRPDKLHTTLLYSRVQLPEYVPLGLMMLANYGTPIGLSILPGEHKERCLVLNYSCPELEERHRYLTEKHSAPYDFPDYITHVTLSYNIGDLDICTLPDIHSYVNSICIVNEYSRNLITNWSSTVLINKS